MIIDQKIYIFFISKQFFLLIDYFKVTLINNRSFHICLILKDLNRK